ncbi:MAG: hypothetical protein PHF86_03500 [Candidatus Nanoarchaeia archaeon]|nr:hypothetical protein [Candidatus Nanoarchaeia archaeon]
MTEMIVKEISEITREEFANLLRATNSKEEFDEVDKYVRSKRIKDKSFFLFITHVESLKKGYFSKDETQKIDPNIINAPYYEDPFNQHDPELSYLRFIG